MTSGLAVLLFTLSVASADNGSHDRTNALGAAVGSAAVGNGLEAGCVDAEKDIKEDCPDPGKYLKEVLDVVNKKKDISEVLTALKLPKGSVVGGNTSFSAQRASGTADPRIFIKTKCGVLTITMWGNNLEMGLVRQFADPTKPGLVGQERAGQIPINTKQEGEILVDMGPFPRKHKFEPRDIVIRPHPCFGKPDSEECKKHDASKIIHANATRAQRHGETKTCFDCHKDSGNGPRTLGALGQKSITIGEETFDAVVSPYYRPPGVDGESTLFCVPQDFQLLYECQCGAKPSTNAQCKHVTREPERGQVYATKEEACARMKAVLDLEPKPHCRFDPRRHSEHPAKCLSDPAYTPDP